MQTRDYADKDTDADADRIRTKNNMSLPMVGDIIKNFGVETFFACSHANVEDSFYLAFIDWKASFFIGKIITKGLLPFPQSVLSVTLIVLL